jgi:2-(1,2-epoxy-1,2-dihydrophenyl)acetyl-CoA isomerase
MRLLKRALYNAENLTFDQAAEDIATRTAISDHHADALEAGPAWLRKDPVVFNRWLDETQ